MPLSAASAERRRHDYFSRHYFRCLIIYAAISPQLPPPLAITLR